jgi:putative two-component system response regulator
VYKILIVDDEPSIRKTFLKFLSNEGYETFAAESVNEAFDFLEKENFDLVISDIIMPKVSGIELLKKLKAKHKEVPVVIMTVEPALETATQALKKDAFDYLTKPVDKETLLKVAKHALAQKQLHDEKNILEKENEKYREELERLVIKRTQALEGALKSTIETIASVMELRDPYTAGHERKVGNLAVAIAIKMNLSSEITDCLYVAGYLHDIGKMAVPAEILSKPSALTDTEFEMIKSHVAHGDDILRKVKMPWPVAEVAYQHHERLDGSGYPNGLKADSIRIESKIMAIADVIEAMTSHRPYRAGLGLDVALGEIKENAGTLYDEKVVKATVALFREDNYEFSEEMKEISFVFDN